MKNFILLFLATFFLLFAIIGIVLPILPTTPFIILSTTLFSCNQKIQEKILQIPIFKEYYESYKSKNRISLKTTIISVSFLWITIITSILFIKQLLIKIFLLIVAISVTTHILILYKRKICVKKDKTKLHKKNTHPIKKKINMI